MSDRTKVSRLIAYVLRHNPGELDLEMDKDGWVSASDLVERLRVRKGIYFTLTELKELVDNDQKQRYTFRDDGLIRANQGHSLADVSAINATPVMPPEVLFHGTTQERWEKIQTSDGLSKMKRHHVHLSADYETALVVAKRRKKETPIVLRVDSFQMFLEHFEFLVSDNSVWLVDRVPKEYLSVAKPPLTLK